MSRNRKHQTAAVRFGPALKALALCVFLGGSGLGYVWQKDQINELGKRLTEAEIRFDKVRRQNEKLERVLETLRTPAAIEARIQETDLGMIEPKPEQIVRLIEPLPASEVASKADERLFAAQRFREWVQP